MRKEKQIDRKPLAELSGLSKNQISQYEADEAEPTIESLVAIGKKPQRDGVITVGFVLLDAFYATMYVGRCQVW